MRDEKDAAHDLVDELWALVEKHKDEGPGPVLRILADRVLNERALVVGYLQSEATNYLDHKQICDAIAEGKHVR